jgi:hypothetical protein
VIYLFIIYPILYLIILITGIINYAKIKDNFYLKLFLFFIAYSLTTEILGFVIGVLYEINTYPINNGWILVSHFFYLFFFLSLLKSAFKRNIVKYGIVCYTIYTLINISFFSDYLTEFLDINSIVGGILIVISIMIYFSELVQSDGILNLKKSMFFWISLGALFFYIGVIPVDVIAKFINFGVALRVITLLLNLLMAGFFITGFIVSEKEYNR